MSTLTISILFVILLATVSSFLMKKTDWLLYSQGSDKPLKPYVAVLSIFASLNGGFMVLGLVQVGFEGGLTGYILGIAYTVGVFLLIYLIKKIKQNSLELKGLYGIDNILLQKYGSKTLVAFYIFTGIAFIGVLGGQLVSISQYLHKYGDIYNIIIVVGIGVIGTMVYTILHGFKGVLANDIIQSLIELSVSLIFLVSIYIFIEDKSSIVNFNISEEATNFGGKYGKPYPIIGSLFLMLAFSTRADIWQRINLVKPSAQKPTLIVSGILLTFYYFCMTTAGLLIKQNINNFSIGEKQNLGSLTVDLTEQIMANVTSCNWFNFSLEVLCLSGILIAILSSIDSYLNLTSLSITKAALWNSISKIDISEQTEIEKKTLIANARLTTIIVAIVGGVFALIIPDIVDLMSASFSVIGVLIPITIYGITSKEKLTDRTGAIPMWISLIILLICLPFLKKLAFLPAFGIGVILFFIIKYIDRKKKSSH